MEFDSQLLQDLLDFLRTLEGVSLPAKFENLRGKLLGRVRTAISVASNYMDMQPGKPLKSDNLIADNSSEDYVVADQQPQSPTSFLYQFKYKNADNVDAKQPRPSPKPLPLKSSDSVHLESTRQRVIQLPVIAPEEEPEILEVVEDPDPLLEIYNDMSLARAEAKSHYFGKLLRRGKWFVFENFRPLWAALIGHYLLTYDNRADQKPGLVLPIKGCTCKPVVASQRNVRRLVESTFEICFEDGRLYEFIASAPKEMEQWVAMIVRWEGKARETNNSHQPVAVPQIVEQEVPSDDPSSNDYYDDLVIHDIAGILATPPKMQSNEPKPPPKIPETKAKQASPIYPKVFNRVLPPPPSATQHSEQEDEVYHVIDDHVQPSTSAHLNKRIEQNEVQKSSVQNAGGNNEELYDDIETMMEEVKQLELANLSKKETEKSSPALDIADNGLAVYDDVGVLRNEVEQLRKNETSVAKDSVKIQKEKKPVVPVRPSPKKNFFSRFRNKSESPEKETGKKKPPVPSPQQMAKIQNTPEASSDRNAMETGNGCVNDTTLEDLSNYNSVPPPRPVETEKSVSDNEEECIYDDVLNRKDTHNNHIVNSKGALEKRKENENSVSVKSEKSVARNLNDEFDGEIYQNQTEVGNVEHESEHYQIPRASGNAQPLEDDDAERIYDDVAIVAQKKREIEQSKNKPAVKTAPKFTRGPAVMAKPSANKLFNKLNKFPLSVSDKSSTEKNSQHRLIAGKKPKTQEADIPLKKRLLTTANEELYDDCLTK